MTTFKAGSTHTVRHSETVTASYTIAGGNTEGLAGAIAIIAPGVTMTSKDAITVQGGTAGYHSPTGSGTLINNGVLTSTGALAVDGGQGSNIGYFGSDGAVGAVLINTGVLVNTGALALVGGGGGGGYLSRAGGGAFLSDTGTLSNHGSLTVGGGEGGGGIGYSDGGTGAALAVSGVLINVGSMTIEGGNSGFSVGDSGSGGEVQVSGVMTNSGAISITGGSIYYGFPPGPGGGQLDVSGQLNDSGLISLQNYGYYGALNIESGGTLALSGAALIAGGGNLINSGLISGSGTIAGNDFTNNGTVIATHGLLTIDGSIAGSGTFEVGPGGTLDINGTITRDQMIIPTASVATPVDTALGLMAAQISDFAAADKIDIADLLPSGAALSSRAAAPIALQAAAGQTATPPLFGNFSAGSLNIAGTGHGGVSTDFHAIP